MDALWFGPGVGEPGRYRFDAPAGEFGVCYFGASLDVAILETLVRGATVIARDQADGRAASRFVAADELRFLRFEGPGLVRLGVGGDVAHGADYGPCQQVALELYRTRPEIDGIQFRSRWDTSQLCWAVFDRARARLGTPRSRQSLGDYDVIGPTLERHDIAVV